MTNNNTFYLDYNVTGSERKRLVSAISNYTGEKPKYLGMPSMAYEVGPFEIDASGCVRFDDRDGIEGLIEQLVQQGFVAQVSDLGCEDDAPADEPQEAEASAEPTDDADGLTVSLPLDGFNPDSLDRLQKLVDSKATLIQKALGADRLTIRVSGDKVEFPWWGRMPEPDEVQAYLSFIAAISAMAKEAKRVTSTEKEVEIEKYAFRCFLLRLGFIGSENKDHRKVLMQRLSGSSAFPNKQAADAFSAAQKAKRDAAKAAAAAETVAEPATENEEVITIAVSE